MKTIVLALGMMVSSNGIPVEGPQPKDALGRPVCLDEQGFVGICPYGFEPYETIADLKRRLKALEDWVNSLPEDVE